MQLAVPDKVCTPSVGKSMQNLFLSHVKLWKNFNLTTLISESKREVHIQYIIHANRIMYVKYDLKFSEIKQNATLLLKMKF